MVKLRREFNLPEYYFQGFGGINLLSGLMSYYYLKTGKRATEENISFTDYNSYNDLSLAQYLSFRENGLCLSPHFWMNKSIGRIGCFLVAVEPINIWV